MVAFVEIGAVAVEAGSLAAVEVVLLLM